MNFSILVDHFDDFIDVVPKDVDELIANLIVQVFLRLDVDQEGGEDDGYLDWMDRCEVINDDWGQLRYCLSCYSEA